MVQKACWENHMLFFLTGLSLKLRPLKAWVSAVVLGLESH